MTLEEYAKELYGSYPLELTLDKLIESHRNLRNLNMGHEEYRNEVMREGREIGYQQGLELAKHEHISIQSLKKMSILEVAKLLADEI